MSNNIIEKTIINRFDRTEKNSVIDSETLQEYSVDSILTDEENRTLWINGTPFGNAYIHFDGTEVSKTQQPTHAEIFNDFENNIALGNYSHAEGYENKTEAQYSHVEGQKNIINSDPKDNAQASHAEGCENIINNAPNSHAEGKGNKIETRGREAHVEGYGNTATAQAAHAEGSGTTASGLASHTEGYYTTASGDSSHAEGSETYAEGHYSHTEGLGTKTTNEAEHASGKYNVSNTGTIFSVGIGTSDDDRKNAFEITSDGDVYIGADDDDNNPCSYPGDSKTTLQSLILNQNLEEINYADLVSKRNNSGLIPGKFYRIVDYITTTTQENTASAGYQFDIIVLALSTNTLSEDAWAVQHNNETHFNNSNLGAWQLRYCLDNERFDWGDIHGGKGIIYRMIDEFGNDCPYDFKNILYKLPTPQDQSKYKLYYTFTGGYKTLNKPAFIPSNIDGDDYDWSLSGEVKQNQILTNSNDLPTVILYSYVGLNISPYSYCRGNKIVNCSLIYLDQSPENTIYDKHGEYYSNLLTFAGYRNYFIFNGNILANNVYQSNQ